MHFWCPGPCKAQFVSPTELEVEAIQEVQCPGNNTLDIRENWMKRVRDSLKKKEAVWKAKLTHEVTVLLVVPSWDTDSNERQRVVGAHLLATVLRDSTIVL